jgi:hypothetical protein
MAVEDEDLSYEDEADEVEIEEDADQEVDAGDGDEDEESEETAGAADGERQEASGRQEGSVRQPSRAERRVHQALREAKEAKAEVERLRGEAQQRTIQQNQETPAQRAERLAMMDPDDRVNYLLQEQGQRFNNELAQIRFQSADSADRTAFESLCARNPVASKLAGQVEERLAELRRNGTTAPRDTVLKYLIGERAMANAGRAKGKATRVAATNTARQTSRPASARNDTGGENRRATGEQEARRKRLEDIQI